MTLDFSSCNVLLDSIENELNIPVIYFVFNELEEIQRAHIKKITKFLDSLKKSVDSVLVILEGVGGDSTAGKQFALELRCRFKRGYFVAVPYFVKSAMVFSIFPSSALLIDDEGYITPIEPLIKQNLRLVSTVELIKNSPKHKPKAVKEWEKQANHLFNMFRAEASIVHKGTEGLHVNELKPITKLFLLSPHTKKIQKNELSDVGFKCLDYSGEKFWDNIKSFTKELKARMIQNKKITFVMGTNKQHILGTNKQHIIV
ncbi:hypothetical protein GOV04_01115 [Candidatus Woesearchaeota archaeon]|nr:hypothetical protein [Candidatus Woesearchaeota archaeon]